MTDGSTGSVPAGWYPDPWHLSTLRWWDGQSWTGNTHSAPLQPTQESLPTFPWRPWAPWFVAILIVSVVCFAKGESKTVKDWVAWLIAGFAASGILASIAAAFTLRSKGLKQVAAFALCVACLVAFTTFVTTAPATSRSCNNNNQQRSTGTYDCDTNDGLGGPLLIAIFFIPAFGMACAGKGLGELVSKKGGDPT